MNVVFKQRLPKSSAQEVLVSILIPARNEEKTIGKLLNDLQQQDYQNIEVFVYNDQSSDNTANIVEQYVQKDARFHVINWYGWSVWSIMDQIPNQHSHSILKNIIQRKPLPKSYNKPIMTFTKTASTNRKTPSNDLSRLHSHSIHSHSVDGSSYECGV